MQILMNCRQSVSIFVFLSVLSQNSANYASHTVYRPTRDSCYASVYSNETFAIVRATGTTFLCKSNSAFAPSSYTESRIIPQPDTRYSVWPEVAGVPGTTVLFGTSNACAQTPKTLLCPNQDETPLFITSSTARSAFECRCKEGHFRKHALSGNAATAGCTPCPYDQFCPVHTNRHFSCPAHTKVLTALGASADGVQRLLSLTSPDAYCKADSGYVLEHAFADISDFVRESRKMTSSSMEFYTTRECAEPASCFERTLCDVAGQMMQFTSKCPPGHFLRTLQAAPESELVLCQECPPDSYCIQDTQFKCPSNQSTYGGGHSSETACRCRAGSYKEGLMCVNISNRGLYSRTCRSASDKACGIKLICPRGQLCEGGRIVLSCALGEFLDTTLRVCASCPVGSYCVGSGVAQACPHGASSRAIRASSHRDCFCVPPFAPLIVMGTAAVLMCESPPQNHSSASSATNRGILLDDGDHGASNVRLKIESRYPHMFVEHSKAGRVLGGTVLVLNSSNLNLVVHFFIHEPMSNGVTLAISSLSLQDTIVATTMARLDTVIMSAFLDFDAMLAFRDNADDAPLENQRLVLYIMLMDIQKGLVCRGVLQTRLHDITHVLTLHSQTWSPMWEFEEASYYRTMPLDSQYSVAAHQESNMAKVQVELALLNQEINRNHTYHDLIKLELLTGIVRVSQIITFRTPLEHLLRPSMLMLGSDVAFVSFCDLPTTTTEANAGVELARFDSTTWESVPMPYGTPGCKEKLHQGRRPDPYHIRVSATQIVKYRSLSEDEVVVFEDTDAKTFGILNLKHVRCGVGAWAHAASFFSCVCRPGYKRDKRMKASDVANGDNACVPCSSVEICNTQITPASNASKCAPGYKLHDAGAQCILCNEDEYCRDSRTQPCPVHSSTMQKRGAAELAACICKPGYHYIRVAESGFCGECRRPFFCTQSRQQKCPANTSTMSDRAESSAKCECWPGFFDETQFSAGATIVPLPISAPPPNTVQQTVRVCREAPVGFYTDGLSGLTQCPLTESTMHTQSTSVSQCGCAGGFKRNINLQTANGGRCAPCVRDEMCSAESAGVVGTCTQLYMQVVNQKNDACVCQAGFVDELATQKGAIRCAPCPPGYYCPQELAPKVPATVLLCPHQTTSHPGTSSVAGCFCKQASRNLMTSPVPPFTLRCLCASTQYESMDGTCTPCPRNMFVSRQSMFSETPIMPRVLACQCISGFYRRELTVTDDNSDVATCAICPVGHFCAAERNQVHPTPCARGTFGPSIGQRDERGCLQCPLVNTTWADSVSANYSAPTTSVTPSSMTPTTSRAMYGAASSAPGETSELIGAQDAQGTVVDCFVEFTPIYYNRELDFEVCSFVFVAFSTNIRTVQMRQTVARIFQHTLESVEAIPGFNRIQYSVTLTPKFFLDILVEVSRMHEAWSIIRSQTPDNPTFYESAVRYFFCDAMARIADDIHPGAIDVAVCYLPMDRITTSGENCTMCCLVRSVGAP